MKKIGQIILILVLWSHSVDADVVIENLDGIFCATIRGDKDLNFLKKTLENIDLSHMLGIFGWIDCLPNSRHSCQIGLNSTEAFFVSTNNRTLKAKIGDLKLKATTLASFMSSDGKVRIWCDPNEGLLYQDARHPGVYLRKAECYVAIKITYYHKL